MMRFIQAKSFQSLEIKMVMNPNRLILNGFASLFPDLSLAICTGSIIPVKSSIFTCGSRLGLRLVLKT